MVGNGIYVSILTFDGKSNWYEIWVTFFILFASSSRQTEPETDSPDDSRNEVVKQSNKTK
jgi:hypothetical protein